MKEIVFLTNHKGIQGSYLNHLDLQQYLKDQEGYKVKFYCENVKKLFEVIKLSRRNYKFKKGEIKILTKNLILPNNIVITDFKTLITLFYDKNYIIGKKIIIMDSIELTYHLKNMKKARFYYDINIYKLIKQFYANEIIFLMPPNNYKLFKERYPNLNAQIFFKNINIDVLNTIKYKNNDDYFYRWDTSNKDIEQIKKIYGNDCISYEPKWTLKNGRRVPLKYNESKFIFDYKNLIYRRRKYLEYQEQFGRLIFEYILLGKTVYFLSEPRTNDGLTDYLNHFNIQFENNKIITTKEELEEKMKIYNIKPWEN